MTLVIVFGTLRDVVRDKNIEPESVIDKVSVLKPTVTVTFH